MSKVIFTLALALALITLPTAALAVCTIDGVVTAEPNLAHPEMGDWMYTLHLTWDTGVQYALSHFDLVLDVPGGTCSCSTFLAGLNWTNPAGSSDGEPEICSVEYDIMLECNGDPSIPGDEGIILKFEPIEDDACEPGPMGSGTFVFYSDLGPAPIDEDALLLIQKFAGLACAGRLSGDFPGFPCDPVGAQSATWGRIKTLYDR